MIRWICRHKRHRQLRKWFCVQRDRDRPQRCECHLFRRWHRQSRALLRWHKEGLERYRTTGTGAEPLAVESTDASATVAQLLELYRNSASPADNDGLFGLFGYFNDAAATRRSVSGCELTRRRWPTGTRICACCSTPSVGGTLANRIESAVAGADSSDPRAAAIWGLELSISITVSTKTD